MALKDIECGHVVKEFMLGDTKIQICDDYCRDKTQEEIDEILERIGDIYLRDLRQQEYRKRQQEELV